MTQFLVCGNALLESNSNQSIMECTSNELQLKSQESYISNQDTVTRLKDPITNNKF